MSQRGTVNIAALLIALTLVFSCAKFQPAVDQNLILLGGNRIPSVTQTEIPITVSIEEFASPTKSKQAFDADVIASGVLPLLFRFDNKGDTTFKLPVSGVKAYLGQQTLELIDGEAAA